MSKLNYFKFYNEESETTCEVFLELNDNYAIRQCELTDIVVSSSIYGTENEPQPVLSEGSLHESIDCFTQISNVEFEEKWKIVLQNNLKNWHKIKLAFPVSSEHTVNTLMFYPQGVLLQSNNAYFLMENEEYNYLVPPNKRYPNSKVNVKVVDQLEKLQWLKVTKP